MRVVCGAEMLFGAELRTTKSKRLGGGGGGGAVVRGASTLTSIERGAAGSMMARSALPANYDRKFCASATATTAETTVSVAIGD